MDADQAQAVIEYLHEVRELLGLCRFFAEALVVLLSISVGLQVVRWILSFLRAGVI